MPSPISHKKITRSHSSLIEAAEGIVKKAIQMNEVTKISFGIIKKINIGKPRIKFLTITGGVKAIVRGNAYVQEIYFYTNDTKNTIEILTKTFHARY